MKRCDTHGRTSFYITHLLFATSNDKVLCLRLTAFVEGPVGVLSHTGPTADTFCCSVCLDLCVEGPGHCLFLCFLCACSITGVLKLYPSVRCTAFVHLCRCFTVSGLFSARQLQLDWTSSELPYDPVIDENFWRCLSHTLRSTLQHRKCLSPLKVTVTKTTSLSPFLLTGLFD